MNEEFLNADSVVFEFGGYRHLPSPDLHLGRPQTLTVTSNPAAREFEECLLAWHWDHDAHITNEVGPIREVQPFTLYQIYDIMNSFTRDELSILRKRAAQLIRDRKKRDNNV